MRARIAIFAINALAAGVQYTHFHTLFVCWHCSPICGFLHSVSIHWNIFRCVAALSCASALMMIAFITFKSSLVPLFEGLWNSNSSEFELSGFRRNRTELCDKNAVDRCACCSSITGYTPQAPFPCSCLLPEKYLVFWQINTVMVLNLDGLWEACGNRVTLSTYVCSTYHLVLSVSSSFLRPVSLLFWFQFPSLSLSL